jgi:RNA polymerase sigma-70 factor (ECF subfamily)
MPDVTRILLELRESGGDRDRNAQLVELVYDELRHIAARLLRGERPGHTLQPTALVNEAYLKLVDHTRVQWQDRAHFLCYAARAMRRILIDHARRARADKRGGGWQKVTLDEELGLVEESEFRILALDDALRRFAEQDPRAAQVVELRVFGGLTIEEIAHVLNVSKRTVDGDWSVAKMWLGRELR